MALSLRTKGYTSSYSHELLSQNLQYLVDDANININRLSGLLDGVNQQTLDRIVKGQSKNPNLNVLTKIADFFDISLDALLRTDLSAINKVDANKPSLVPIIHLNEIESDNYIENIDLSHWRNWQQVPANIDAKCNGQAFAIKSLPNMYPKFPINTVLIFDPSVKPQDGDTIIVVCDGVASIQNLEIKGMEYIIKKLDGDSYVKYDKENQKIIAVCLITIILNHRLT